MTRIAINGMGRIGRLLIRRLVQLQSQGQGDFLELVAVNDISDLEGLIYLLKFDSVHGRFNGQVDLQDENLKINDHLVQFFSESNASLLPWEKLDIDVVVDCTGRCSTRDDAKKHLQAGARKVLVSAPLKSADSTIVLGVNEGDYEDRKHDVVSNASCTTNSLAPPLKALSDRFGIESALATTVHAYTISQSLVDKSESKRIRGRAGAVNIIPTSTGSDVATVQVLPELEGRISVVALRVPVVDGSITDINVVLKNNVTVEAVNSALKESSENDMYGVMEYSDEDIVSSDIIGNTHSAIIHAKSTRVVQGNVVKIQAWYDNEYGYACRLMDTVKLIGQSLTRD